MKTIPNISKINIKLTLILSVFVMLWSLESNASVYGVLKGKVLDTDGKPAIGASVRVMGTTRGAKVKVDGEFTIVNLLAGTYEMKVSHTGAKEYKDSVTILADGTISIVEIKLENSQNSSEFVVFGIKTIYDKYIFSEQNIDTSLENNKNVENLKIYPNPVVNSSVIEFESQENMITKVVVTNLKTMFSKEIIRINPILEISELKRFNSNTFDFSSFEDGKYLLSLEYQFGNENRVKNALKFIINKK